MILPILVMLLMGTVTAGLSYSHAIGLTNASREGARFGATTEITSANPAATWAGTVLTRVRQTQFDDKAVATGSQTSVCVQLYKIGTGAVANSTACSQGTDNAPAVSPLTFPAATADPVVPSGTAGSCVVRVLTQRRFSVSLAVFPAFNGVIKRWSVARYERSGC